MNIIQKIAAQIEARIEFQANQQKLETGKAMGQKVKDKMNLDLWAGAIAGVTALDGELGENTKWITRVVVMVVWPSGYTETQRIAQEGRDADRVVDAAAAAQ